MSTLAILGASGHAKVVADAALSAGWQRILFFDDAWPKLKHILDWDIIGTTADLIKNKAVFQKAIIAIGNNEIRLQKAKLLSQYKISFATIIHPHAVVSRFSNIGAGTVVFAGSVINASSCISDHCIINTNAIVDHDCMLNEGVHICPGANLAGNVIVGEQSWIGLGASIKQQINIGKRVLVGAGAVVVKDVQDDSTVIGVPAK